MSAENLTNELDNLSVEDAQGFTTPEEESGRTSTSMFLSPPPKLPASNLRSPYTAPKVTAPIMGGLVEQYGGKPSIPFTGGEPNASWTGLKTPTTKPRNSQCLHTVVTTNYHHKTGGLSPQYGGKYKKAGNLNLARFLKKIGQHAKQWGLDTILWVQHPTEKTTMVWLPESYALFTVAQVKAYVDALALRKWDSFDLQNDQDLMIYLQNSIDDDMATALDYLTPEDEHAVVYLMRIIQKNADSSIEQWTRMKDAIKAASPLDEPGENITLYNAKILSWYTQLKSAQCWDWTSLLYIIQAYSKVSVPVFASYYQGQVRDVDRMLARGGSSTDMEKYFTDRNLDPPTLLTEGEEFFISLSERKEWSAQKPSDRSGAPSMNLANMTGTQLEAFMMKVVTNTMKKAPIQPHPNKPGQKCFNCDSPDHLSPYCPLPKKTGNKKKSNSNNTGQSGQSRTVHWRNTAPTNGQETMVKDGRTFHWCQKCKKGKGIWSPTHGTSQHGQQPSNGSGPSANLANTAEEQPPFFF